jgi:hypothetical protein
LQKKLKSLGDTKPQAQAAVAQARFLAFMFTLLDPPGPPIAWSMPVSMQLQHGRGH